MLYRKLEDYVTNSSTKIDMYIDTIETTVFCTLKHLNLISNSSVCIAKATDVVHVVSL